MDVLNEEVNTHVSRSGHHLRTIQGTGKRNKYRIRFNFHGVKTTYYGSWILVIFAFVHTFAKGHVLSLHKRLI